MSLTGALNAAVTGLRAQSQGLGIISDNIANAATIGYKSTSSNFASLVTQAPTGTSYTPGGVLPHPFTNVAAQGILQSTNSTTDVAITGAGFFAVTNSIDSVSAKAAGEIGFTRAGSFTLDKSGYLVNNSGQYLLGYPISQSSSAGSLASAQAIGLGKITGSAQATTSLTIGANLPGVATPNTPLTFYGNMQNTQTLPAVNSSVAFQQNNVVLYSSNGNPYSATVTVTRLIPRTAGPPVVEEVAGQVFLSNIQPLNNSPALSANGTATATASSLSAAQAGALGAGATFTAAVGAVPSSTNFNLGASPSGYFNIGSISTSATGVAYTSNSGGAPAFLGGGSANSILQPTIDMSNAIANATPAAAHQVGMAVDEHDIQAVIYDSLGVGQNLTLAFVRNQTVVAPVLPALISTVGNKSNWQVLVKNLTIAKTGSPAAVSYTDSTGQHVPVFPMYLNGSAFTTNAAAAGASSGFSFNGDGSIKSGAPSQLPAFQLITGANTLGGNNGFTLNLGTPNSTSGLSGFDETFGLSFIKQDGIRYGTRTGISIANDGIVSALFNNGQTTQLFRLPLATFANPNALTPTTGSEYLVSDNSGDPTLNFPTQGSAGTLQSSALESSTVDIANEFTTMIVVQRNYEANTKTISTADQMMQQLLNIK